MVLGSVNAVAASVSQSILHYLQGSQEAAAGEYFGSFWSEKAYHGPQLDYHAGGSHHHRTAGSAGLGLWLSGSAEGDREMQHAAEHAFDWLVSRQSPRGGYAEIQNLERPADWERTGLEELSTIATGFAVHGLGQALLAGLPPKKSYMDCLQRAALWQLGLEWPAASGVFPHHERSPHNTLNANLHAAETMGLAYRVLHAVYGRPVAIFLAGAQRAVRRTLGCQSEDGGFPYRDSGGITINYTSLVLWCLLNLLDVLPESARRSLADPEQLALAVDRACGFLRGSVAPDGSLLWEQRETSTAKYNLWTYLIAANVLFRHGTDADRVIAERLLSSAFSRRTAGGLLPMRDRGEEITACAFMQADMLLFLLPWLPIQARSGRTPAP